MNPRLVERARDCNQKLENNEGKYVLYWMISSRRFNSNAALEHAANLAQERNVPLLVLEEISTSHEFANDRICTFMYRDA